MKKSKFLYPNLSNGYIGITNNQASLNAKFFSIILNQKEQLYKDKFSFPQRIPRREFFNELLRLEASNLSGELHNINDECINNITKGLENLSTEKWNFLFNWLNIGMRLGLSEKIFPYLSEQHLIFPSPLNYEFSLLKLAIQLQCYLDTEKEEYKVRGQMSKFIEEILNSEQISKILQLY